MAATRPSNRGHGPSGPLFWTLFAVGWAIMLFGLQGVFDQPNRTRPPNLAMWYVGSAIVHDALVAPAVVALGVAVVKLVPARARRYVQAGLIISGCVVAVALPALIGPGGPGDNPSALPRNYWPETALVLGVVWLGVGLLALWRRRKTVRDQANYKEA